MRGDERVGVDLSVRVGKGDPDLLAAVLEHEHLLDTRQLGQLAGPVGPGFEHSGNAAR
jgi:hypothetical protein